MNWHKGIAASLRIGACLLFVLIVSVVVWGLLAAVGDDEAARAFLRVLAGVVGVVGGSWGGR